MGNVNIQTRTTLKKFELRVEGSQLRVGMFVDKLDRPWKDTPFSIQGFLLRNPAHIQEVQQHCDYVYIDIDKSIHVIDRKQAKQGSGLGAYTNKVRKDNRGGNAARKTPKEQKREEDWNLQHSLSEQDIQSAGQTYKNAYKLVKSTMQGIKLGHSIDANAAKEVVATCVDNIIHRPNAMLLMSRLKSKDQYTLQHSLNVGIISIALARYIGLDKRQLNEVGLCGILHDMGKMRTPDKILNKPSRLTENELKVMQKHPVDGQEILSSTDGIFHEAMNVAHAHHERIDGQGYPLGLPGADLSLYTRIVTIADVFDALTSDRVYKQGCTVEQSVRILHDQRGVAFDPIMVTQFIENVGIYPLGTVVELHNGEIGIVVHTTPDKRLRPWVKILLDKKRNPVRPRIINLAESDVDKDGNPYWVKASHNPGNFDIDLLRHVQGQLE